MKLKNDYNLPVGYHNFHKKQLYNFQFNRWHSLGFARFEDMKEAGQKINNFSDWKNVWVNLAKRLKLRAGFEHYDDNLLTRNNNLFSNNNYFIM